MSLHHVKRVFLVFAGIPPIKAPVGTTPPPKIKQVKSKIGSFDNVTHKPKGGDKKVDKILLAYYTLHREINKTFFVIIIILISPSIQNISQRDCNVIGILWC